MSQISMAGRLLRELQKESQALRDTVATAAGIRPERAAETANGAARLTLAEQLRLSEATMLLAPRMSRHALRLRGQTLAARSYESGEVQLHQELPVERWERSARMRF
jgi:hypothetical protein